MIFEYFIIAGLFAVVIYCWLSNAKLVKIHRAEIDRLHELYAEDRAHLIKSANEERTQLLDRIMANNIHEYKAASGIANVKKSESGNFLVDRMERTLKKQYSDFE